MVMTMNHRDSEHLKIKFVVKDIEINHITALITVKTPAINTNVWSTNINDTLDGR